MYGLRQNNCTGGEETLTGCFEIYLKTPKEGEVHIPSPSIPTGVPVIPDMKDSDKFDYLRVDMVELPYEMQTALYDWWKGASFGDEFVVRCELPT